MLDLRNSSVLLPVLAALGCTSLSTEEFDALQRLTVSVAEARKDYRLLPGDTVKVIVYRGATLPPEYQQEVTVQPDGKITLVNIEKTMPAATLTMDELQANIQKAYEPVFSREPASGKYQVTVQFLTSTKHAWIPDQVYVTGEVQRGVAVPYRDKMTVMQAIAQAGGWKYTGDESRVVLMRMDSEGQTVTRELDLSSVLAHSGNDIELLAGDVVYVPLTVIAKIDLFVEFYIRAVIPINPSVIRTLAVGF